MSGWMSPNFGPIGCFGAIVFWPVIVIMSCDCDFLADNAVSAPPAGA